MIPPREIKRVPDWLQAIIDTGDSAYLQQSMEQTVFWSRCAAHARARGATSKRMRGDQERLAANLRSRSEQIQTALDETAYRRSLGLEW